MFISTAYAQTAPAAAQGGLESSLMSLLPLILMFVVLYFIMIRPQMKRQKEHKAMVDALAKGDGRISAITFLQAYPVGEMEVSIPALMAVLEKAKSISQLVQFFADSPLDGLRSPAKPAP